MSTDDISPFFYIYKHLNKNVTEGCNYKYVFTIQKILLVIFSYLLDVFAIFAKYY